MDDEPKKRGRGRPRLNPGEKKDDLLQVRVPEDYLLKLKAAAERAGTGVSELVRKLLDEWLKDHG